MAFLKTLLVIILIFYVIRWVLVKTFPFLLKKLLKNMTSNYYETSEYARKQQKNTDGKITVNVNADKSKSKIDPNEGEYVDFEEVK